MAARSGPIDPGGDEPRDKVRQLQRRLWVAAKRSAGRRFHALSYGVGCGACVLKRKGRNLRPGEVERWTREYFWSLGLHRLRGTVQYPERPFWQVA
jgi:hypothetical protein